MLYEQVLLAFGTIFTIVNPFSTSFVFTKLTRGMDRKEQHRTALTASFAAPIALITFLLIGQPLLRFFGVTIYAFRVAGGLYLAWIGFEMLSPRMRRDPENYKDQQKTNNETNEELSSIAIIPLAIPLLAGPGALTSVLVLSSEMTWIPVLISILLVCFISWILLRESTLIQKALGHTGTNVVERLLGIFVLVMAVQFVFNGITGYLLTLG
ncbi:MAG: MarC family protein [Planctomycetes bacterium]|nr:MarC family protein [Planctomycetota bacterium]